MAHRTDQMAHPFYRNFLLAELGRRKTKNPRYSLRAFAKALSVDASGLSRILSGKCELSVAQSVFFVKKLRLETCETRLFFASVAEEKSARAASILSSALETSGIDQKQAFEELTLERSEQALLVHKYSFAKRLARSLSMSSGYEASLEKVGSSLVPEVSDWCVIHVRDQAKKYCGTRVTAEDPARQASLQALLRNELQPERFLGFSAGPASGTAELISKVSERHRLGALDIRSMLCVPLRSRARVFGTLTLALSGSSRMLDSHDLDLTEKVGDQSGVAFEGAMAHELLLAH